MTQFEMEVQRFRDWAEAYPYRYGEWECDYPHWNALWGSAIELIDSCADGSIKSSSIHELLFVLARDNETEHLCDANAEYSELLRVLARHAVGCEEPDAKWQFAVAVGESQLADAADLLRPFVTDADEYVRRRSLMSFAPHSPTEAEAIAVHNLDDEYEYTRMAALNILHRIQSPYLPDALARLGNDPNNHVRSCVNELTASTTGG